MLPLTASINLSKRFMVVQFNSHGEILGELLGMIVCTWPHGAASMVKSITKQKRSYCVLSEVFIPAPLKNSYECISLPSIILAITKPLVFISRYKEARLLEASLSLKLNTTDRVD